MISSMTGYGDGQAVSPSRKIKIEIKSLNSKQLDLSVRMSQIFRELEMNVRNIISQKLERGKIEMSVNLENQLNESRVSFNIPLLAAYKKEIDTISQELEIKEPEELWNVLLRLPDVFKQEQSMLTDEDTAAFMEALNTAIENLLSFRREEGERLYFFFVEKINSIRNLLDKISPLEKERVVKIKERLKEQLDSLEKTDYDPGRLEQELIFYIEKLDITEEKVRLNSHLDYFMSTMGDADTLHAQGQGKKLGFIAQEMGREINTMGSKSNHAEMQKIVVMMKDELEQIKEQVLNVL